MGTSEVEEEEYLVHVEFESLLDSETFKDSNLFFKVIGIESEKPIMQIGDQVFTGTYCDIPGTSLFFEEDENEIIGDAVFSKTAEHTLKYKHKTRKSLMMRRVFIKKKVLKTGDEVENDQKVMRDTPNPMDDPELLSDITNSDSLLDRDLEMKSADERDKTQMSATSTVKNTNIVLDSDKKCTKYEDSVCFKKYQGGIEPVAGPSWAPDISPSCKDVMSITVNTDEMSRLIEEQMTLESDISEQNTIQSEPKTS